MTPGFSLLQRALRETFGLALDDEKRYLVEDRLAPVMRTHNIASLEDLGRQVHLHPRADLARAVAEALTINETSFFRDRSLFAALSERILPELIEARKQVRRLRIWSAGCSTGQEPYSIAMMIDEQMRQLSGWHVEILATDLSHPAVDKARAGSFSQFEVQRGVPVNMLLRYFHRDADRWVINDHIRAKIDFRAHNLMASFRDLGRFDLVLCRNVLFYFDAEMKRRVLQGLADALSGDGALVLGGAERVAGFSDSLHADPLNAFVFVKGDAAPVALIA